ncbi:hypothetical protein H6P81_007865 [Aristolochia fimbriata]|uniref:L-2-hydroxyglutarate dehydrogenase, mitochondrial n=1 Tax=Aristolochia fimbriata TaxID=158543 RepID=A0AAV7F4A0_ARIFI|nr:hypothetical protein H6P81_007865 [Aristolochia fimbriata]
MLHCALHKLKRTQQVMHKLSRASLFGDQLGKIPKETADCVVIGAGVVGIAVARELALKGRDVLVVEASSTFGSGTSSRNSEVIHAGIYYPKMSSKAMFCVQGRELLYKYCLDRGIPHKQIGKLIVATRTNEISKLTELLKQGKENRVQGLEMIEGNKAMEMEPELRCVKALLSPCSGIVDSHSLMLSFLGDAETHGATFSYNTAVIGGHIEDDKVYLLVSESKELENCAENAYLEPQLILVPKLVINSAGLSALSLAKRLSGLDHRVIPSSHYARGCYFTLSKTRVLPFKHLIYPIPEDGGLGVHVTLDLDGHVKFGPDVEWIDRIDDISSFLNKFDYKVKESRAEKFYPEIRKYYPNLKDGSLEPGYAGIRSKLSGPGQPPADFIIQGKEIHGVNGLGSFPTVIADTIEPSIFGVLTPRVKKEKPRRREIMDQLRAQKSSYRCTVNNFLIQTCDQVERNVRWLLLPPLKSYQNKVEIPALQRGLPSASQLLHVGAGNCNLQMIKSDSRCRCRGAAADNDFRAGTIGLYKKKRLVDEAFEGDVLHASSPKKATDCKRNHSLVAGATNGEKPKSLWNLKHRVTERLPIRRIRKTRQPLSSSSPVTTSTERRFQRVLKFQGSLTEFSSSQINLIHESRKRDEFTCRVSFHVWHSYRTACRGRLIPPLQQKLRRNRCKFTGKAKIPASLRAAPRRNWPPEHDTPM